jgi:16S rRNA (uracil1498-N3)-methyltransferase
LRRFMVDEIRTENDAFTITGSEARHIARVLRLKPGDRFLLMDPRGARFQALIRTLGSRDVVVTLEKRLPAPLPSPVRIVLCQALLKAQAMDYAVQKTSELGVSAIWPFTSGRTVVRLNPGKADARARHWREVAKSAAKQSNRTLPAEVASPVAFDDLVTRWEREDATKVILWEGEHAQDLRKILSRSGAQGTFIGFVGPEGGFTEREIASARNAGFTSVSLGYRILRAETAAITLVALVQYAWGDLSLEPGSA